jgi:UDP-glucose:(heptosyl)LPS alpha-1,3-glucosyltransferase
LRLAVVSPFLDRTHGTERALSEVLVRLAKNYPCEIHLFAQKVSDLTTVPAHENSHGNRGDIVWYAVRSTGGPHLLQFLVWYFRNRQVRREMVRHVGRPFDLVFSAGINCSDADAIIVHALFHRLRLLPKQEHTPAGALRKLHRTIYYRLLTFLESRIYTRPSVALAAVSPRTKSDIAKFFRRSDVQIIPNAVDAEVFSSQTCQAHRSAARQNLRFAPDDIVLLLIGNDWAVKGLPTILQAMHQSQNRHLRLLVVGADDPAPFQKIAASLEIQPSCRWESPSSDVLQFFAAADIYVSPSLEDSFGMPAAEAMACGLPVITSSQAGISAFVEDGRDAFVQKNPLDPAELARLITALGADAGLRQRVGAAAEKKAQSWTWDKNAAQVWQFLNSALAAKTATHKT